MIKQAQSYIGRFAPSPSGPLHFGSIVTAVASYLDAHCNNGRWLVRIEDIDPNREQIGATEQILRTLEAFGLHWHGSVLYQSQRSEAYDDALQLLLSSDQLYYCTCSRSKLIPYGGNYPGFCRPDNQLIKCHQARPSSLRVKCQPQLIQIFDLVQGKQNFNITIQDDFILKRRDGLFSYQLAVSVDDAFQNITHVVRGIDLIDSTPRQIYLQKILNYKTPVYAHIPVICWQSGRKLSKQNLAPALITNDVRSTMIEVFKALGIELFTELRSCNLADILKWGIEKWSPNIITGVKNRVYETYINSDDCKDLSG